MSAHSVTTQSQVSPEQGTDDKGRRRFLIAATTVVGGIGAGFASVPFILSLQPSAKTRAAGAPVEADISKLEDGQRIIVEWRGKPVWIVKRTQQNLTELATLTNKLRDPTSEEPQQPAYAKNEYRSIKPEYLVVIGICTHLGCSPSYVTADDPSAKNLMSDWKGGFFCPCHGSFFDLAARVYQGVPAPTNLVVPPHKYLSDTRVLVGVDQDGA
jgi:ubiquinol-cytochrome c reductase iron-sulfur subunit